MDDDEPTNPLQRAAAYHFRCTECGAEVVLDDAATIAPVCKACTRYMAPVNHRVRGQA
jgi:hypothetical protein